MWQSGLLIKFAPRNSRVCYLFRIIFIMVHGLCSPRVEAIGRSQTKPCPLEAPVYQRYSFFIFQFTETRLLLQIYIHEKKLTF